MATEHLHGGPRPPLRREFLCVVLVGWDTKGKLKDNIISLSENLEASSNWGRFEPRPQVRMRTPPFPANSLQCRCCDYVLGKAAMAQRAWPFVR